jgi:hypothetical protein
MFGKTLIDQNVVEYGLAILKISEHLIVLKYIMVIACHI